MSSFKLGAAIAVALLDSADDDEGSDDVEALSLLTVCEDTMGHDRIVYFPEVEWVEEEDADGDERCDACGKVVEELSQATAFPGVVKEDGTLGSRWVCDSCYEGGSR